jgi:hypothetical protein
VNVKNLEYWPDNFLLQALETALPNRIASLLQLANDEDAPIADWAAEALSFSLALILALMLVSGLRAPH